MNHSYKTTIGLEIHVELATNTKIFCGCSTTFGNPPNSNTCPVCTAMPGTLPVLNKKVVEYAMAVGLALNCTITKNTRFDRKNYFYPDNPQNYQISQLYHPICKEGFLEIETLTGNKKIGISDIHMEEDAGKLIHDELENVSYIDYNRAGVPLIEIVTKPEMESEEEVILFLEKLRKRIQYLGASDCKLQEGSMRVDVNLSIKKAEETKLGTRTEMKNLNSFKAIKRAIQHERQRQIEILESGLEVEQETRRWDDNKENSYSMRSKEDAKDYRYFKEPDLVCLEISDSWIEKIKEKQPEFQEDKVKKYVKEYKLREYDAKVITETKEMAKMFESVVTICNKPKKISNWLMVETMRLQNEKNMEQYNIPYSAKNLAKLIELTEEKIINSTVAKEVFEKIFENDIDPIIYVKENKLGTIEDENTLKDIVIEVIKNNQKSVEDYKKGKEKAIGFLVGQSMKALKGKGNPSKITTLLKELLKQ